MGASFGGKGGLMADINVTPFVDVMLVLLIIFMVTAPMMTEGMDIDLPKARTTETLSMDDGVLLTLRRDGSMRLDELPLERQDLPTALARLAGRHLFFKADRDVPYGVVVDILGAVRAAGVEKFGVVAENAGEER
jgi:biopolymer transport protein TolR